MIKASVLNSVLDNKHGHNAGIIICFPTGQESIYYKQKMFFEFLFFCFPCSLGRSLVVCSAVHASHACARYGLVVEWRIWNLCRAFFDL